MGLNANEGIVYQDLLNYTLQLVKSKCSNIDSFASNVPGQLKNGTSWIIKSATVSKVTYTNVNTNFTITAKLFQVQQFHHN